jgi:hypothetical protein
LWIPISNHRRRRSLGFGATFEGVTRRRQPTLAHRPKQAPRRTQVRWTQLTDISISNRRQYRLRLFRWFEQPITHMRTQRPPPLLGVVAYLTTEVISTPILRR